MQVWHEGLELLSVTADRRSLRQRKNRIHWQSHIHLAERADITIRKERNKLRMRQVRALENEDDADRRRERNKLRMRQVRALENNIEAERRREKNKLRMRQVRAVGKMDCERSIDFNTSQISMVCSDNMIVSEQCKEENQDSVDIEEKNIEDSCNGTNVNQPGL